MNSAEWVVDIWNQYVPIGTPVDLRNDLDEIEYTRTRSAAWVCGDQPVVKVNGRTGGYLVYRLTPRPRLEGNLLFQAAHILHQQTFNALAAVIGAMRAEAAKTPPSFKPMFEIRQDFLDLAMGMMRDLDPHNDAAMHAVLEGLTKPSPSGQGIELEGFDGPKK